MKRRRRRLSMPRFLWAIWLLLNDSLAPGSVVFGLVLSFVLVWAAAPLRPLRAFPKKPWTSAKLICHVAADIAASNVAVARLICSGRHASPKPGFVKIPLTLRDPHGLAALDRKSTRLNSSH